MATEDNLRDRAKEIRGAFEPSSVTNEAVGGLLLDMINFFIDYGGSGGEGGKPDARYWSKEELKVLDQYLYVLNDKIKALYADSAGDSELFKGHGWEDHFDQPVRSVDDVIFKSVTITDELMTDNFIGGLTGTGAKIFDTGHGEFESMFIRRFLEVPELRFNRAEIVLGDKWRSPGAGIVESVEPDYDIDGNLLRSGTITLKLQDGEIGAVAVDDICMGYFHDFGIPGNNAVSDMDDSRGNRMFSGFCTIYFRITEILDAGTNKRFRYVLRGVSDRWKHSFHPFEAMHFVAYGNFTNKDRQTSAYETRTYSRFLIGVNDWEFTSSMIAMQLGDLSNLNVFGLDMTGYSAYLNNIYMTGTIEQLQNEPVRVEIDTRGDNFLAYGESMEITCKVFKGWEDITDTVKKWTIRRDSGDLADDEAWNIKHKDFNGSITIYNTKEINDLGNNSVTVISTLFTITATNDTESAEAILTI